MHCVLNYIITGKFTSMQGFFYWSKHVIIKWSWVSAIPGVWEKFKFQLPDCFIGSCHRMWTCVNVEQKNPLGQQTSALVANHGLQPSDHKKQITPFFSTALQFESTVPIFKEDL
jgi:hypothetical protein